MEKNQKYILEINEKIEEIQNRLATIPEEIQEVNGKLLEESVKICYGEMKEHQKALEELNEWIEKTRELLKAKLEEKTIHEEKASQIYSYLHDLVGADFIDYLDKNYWR
jgi:predicted nuclease with TOPRIM domain